VLLYGKLICDFNRIARINKINKFKFHSFIQAISIAPLQIQFYLEVLQTTARILCRSLTPKRHRQLRVKNLLRVLTRGLRVKHICYPTRTRSTGPLPYPYPTRTQNYYPARPVPAGIPVPVTVQPSQVPMHRLCSYQADRLANRHVVIV